MAHELSWPRALILLPSTGLDDAMVGDSGLPLFRCMKRHFHFNLILTEVQAYKQHIQKIDLCGRLMFNKILFILEKIFSIIV